MNHSRKYRKPFIEYNGKQYELPNFRRSMGDGNKPANLVYCFDGTGAEFGLQPFTNVLELFKMLEKDYPSQICYYQPGIGVQFHPDSNDIRDSNFINSKISKVSNTVDAMIAFTLKQHVIAAYVSLSKFYNKGDRVFLFGFSRGSFTARVLAGMIEQVGLLNAGMEDMAITAWELYSNWEYSGQPAPSDPKVTMIEQFRETFTRNKFQIEFMGLWDSVNSVGFLIDRLFPYTTHNSIVKHIRHAISLDERRAKFKQLMVEQHPICDSGQLSTKSNQSSIGSSVVDFFTKIIHPTIKHERGHCNISQDIVEMYFPGDHSDCGGGWKQDEGGGVLSNISLRWMISEVAEFGILFKLGSIHKFNDVKPLITDLLSYNHDMLSLSPASSGTNDGNVPEVPIHRFDSHGDSSLIPTLYWWSIELLPIQYKHERSNGEWRRVLEPNLGKHRQIPFDCRIHWSFFYRVHFVEDYTINPTLLRSNIGEKMIESLKNYELLYKGLNLDEYCKSLTVDQIRTDWQNKIWSVIPNDLQKCLDRDPKI